MKKRFDRLLAGILLMVIFTTGGGYSEGDLMIPQPPAEQKEMEENEMANVPVLNIGGIDYNVKDIEGRNQIIDLKIALNQSLPASEKRGMTSFDLLGEFFYKKNAYIDNNGTEVTAEGTSIFKIPIKRNTVVLMGWDERPIPENFSFSYFIRLFDSNGNVYANSNGEYMLKETPPGEYMLNLYAAQHDYITMSVVVANDSFSHIWIKILDPSTDNFRYNGARPANKLVYTVDETNAVINHFYAGNNGYGTLGDPGFTLWTTVKAGDKLNFKNKAIPGFNFYGFFIGQSIETGKGWQISDLYTFTEDGVIGVFGTPDNMANGIVYPTDSDKIEYKNIVNVPIIPNVNPYGGLDGVAYGTSLTANALPGRTGGYLTYLPELSGITFTNRGTGGGCILPHEGASDMYTSIISNTDYSDYDICILEGFVNDWYYNAASLGTWKDDNLTTVCGRVRSAINHIFNQNANITLFMILDHFGKQETASTVENDAGQTQFEFYQEIEKVALSMGVRVIREYEISEISERTPQYLMDNIHLTDLGCRQSANAIWSAMKDTYPSVQLADPNLKRK